MKLDNKKIEKNIAVFIIYEGTVPKVIGRKSFKIDDNRTISFRKNAFPIIYDQPTYRIGMTLYYYFDFLSTGQLIPEKILQDHEIILEASNENSEPKTVLVPTGRLVISRSKKANVMDILRVRIMDHICNRDTIEQLLEADELKKNWFDIIFGILAGIGVGLFVGLLIGLSGWVPVV